MSPGPAIILVEPQLGENIGAAARAMLNCGLTDLRLVRPRDGWPNPGARSMAAGADAVLEAVRVFDSTAAAVADRSLVLATTARSRDMMKRVATPREAAVELRLAVAGGLRCGVLFGPERTGLTNDDLSLADAIVAVPLNPAFSSLNLAQAVLLVAYEWFQAGLGDAAPTPAPGAAAPGAALPPPDLASKAEMQGLFDHLESELDRCGFLRVAEKRPAMVRTIRAMLTRAALRAHEVATWRGIIACLSVGRGIPRGTVRGIPRRRPTASETAGDDGV